MYLIYSLVYSLAFLLMLPLFLLRREAAGKQRALDLDTTIQSDLPAV